MYRYNPLQEYHLAAFHFNFKTVQCKAQGFVPHQNLMSCLDGQVVSVLANHCYESVFEGNEFKPLPNVRWR